MKAIIGLGCKCLRELFLHLVPCFINKVAWVCRRSWNLIPRIGAFLGVRPGHVDPLASPWLEITMPLPNRATTTSFEAYRPSDSHHSENNTRPGGPCQI